MTRGRVCYFFKMVLYTERKVFCKMDGEEVATGPATIKEIPDTEVNFSIGGRELGGDLVDGIIDEVAVYRRALTEDEIKQDMKGIKTAVSPSGKLATTWASIK